MTLAGKQAELPKDEKPLVRSACYFAHTEVCGEEDLPGGNGHGSGDGGGAGICAEDLRGHSLYGGILSLFLVAA